MRRLWFPCACGLVAAAAMAGAQAPSAVPVLNRVASAYRTAESFRAVGTVTRRIDEKELTATVALAAQRPAKFLLDVKGDKLNTVIVSDGTLLVASRPDRKIHTKVKAPARLMMTDVIGSVEVPTPASRVVAILLEGRLRDANDPLARAVAGAAIADSVFGGKPAYVLSFDYADSYPAKLTITANDYLVRRLEIRRDGRPFVTETYTQVEVGRPLPPDTFARDVTEGSLLVSSLPPLAAMTVNTAPLAPDFAMKTVSGESVTLSKLRGKVVLLNFFFVT